MGASSRRAKAGAPERTPSRRHAAHGLRLPLQLERLERLDEHGVAHQTVRCLADQDLPGAGRGLEALSDGDGAAGGECVALGGIAGDDLPRVDAGPHPELDPVLGAQLVVQCGESFAELACGANGPQGVVLVQDRDSERGHDRVADELLDRATVMFEHAADLDEVPRDHVPVRLGV